MADKVTMTKAEFVYLWQAACLLVTHKLSPSSAHEYDAQALEIAEALDGFGFTRPEMPLMVQAAVMHI